MRLLFTIDQKDYEKNWKTFVRNSARAIILRDKMVAMVYSFKYHYDKFPGGGIRKGETPEEAMARETAEEAGLLVIPESIRAYGYVHRVQKSTHGSAKIFMQDNLYYFCDVRRTTCSQNLDAYEAAEHFTLQWVDPRQAIAVNRYDAHGPTSQIMLEREARVLELLLAESYFQ